MIIRKLTQTPAKNNEHKQVSTPIPLSLYPFYTHTKARMLKQANGPLTQNEPAS